MAPNLLGDLGGLRASLGIAGVSLNIRELFEFTYRAGLTANSC